MRMRWLARLLLPRMRAYAARRDAPHGKPDLEIKDNSLENKTYLKRWFVLPRGKWWHPGLYLHNMLGNDNATLHDHPYWSVSLVLSDGIVERYVRDAPESYRNFVTKGVVAAGGTPTAAFHPSMIETRRIPQGAIVFRSSRFAHQLLVELGTDPWTLFFTGRRLKKDWGFWCPRGWRHWSVFHGAKKADLKMAYDPATYGITKMEVGCGEQS